MRTIRVTGKANMKIAPDQTKVNLTIRGFAMDYSEALAKSVEDTKHVKDALAACGMDRKLLKTANFYTSEKTKRIEDQYGNVSYRHIGYDVTHNLNFTFDNNNEKLGMIIYQLSRLSIKPRISINYVVKNPEMYKAELIKQAVHDAKSKASVMAEASGLQLGEIMNMDYSYETVFLESREYMDIKCESLKCITDGAFDVDIEPEDVNLADTVTIVWEIK